MRDTVLTRAVEQAKAAAVKETGSCKWCFPTPNAHANYHCLCSVDCGSSYCPVSAVGRCPSDLCGIPVEIAPVPVFRVQ